MWIAQWINACAASEMLMCVRLYARSSSWRALTCAHALGGLGSRFPIPLFKRLVGNLSLQR